MLLDELGIMCMFRQGEGEWETIVNFQKVVSKCLDKPWAHIDFF